MARREELEDAGKDRSKKRRTEDESPSHRRHDRGGEDDDKRREKHKHKHRKHKHRRHRKEGGAEVITSAAPDETEDGEILEADVVLAAAAAVDKNLIAGTNAEEEPKHSSPRRSREKSPARKRSRSREVSPEKRYSSKSRGDSLDRKRRSRSRDLATRSHVHGSGTHGVSPDRKRRRSRSREPGSRRGEERGRRYGYSPERRRRSRSREYDDRERHRRRGDSRDRSYRDDRGRDDERHQRGRREREEVSKGEEKLSAEQQNVVDEENQDEYLERVANQLAEQEEDVEKVKEESRKRRQAIMEKYKKQQQEQVSGEKQSAPEAPPSAAPAPASEPDSGEGIINPATPVTLGEPVSDNGNQNAGVLGEGSPPKHENPGDMFCDIFGETPVDIRGQGDMAVDTSGLTDNWDDADGYYMHRVGEVLDNRYEVASSHGRGVFSTVVKARDLKAARGNSEEVAIKIIRSNETMFKAGQMELVILRKLAGADPENKRHCVRLLSSFEYRNHLCLVFESLHMNLRETLKKFGRNIGLSLQAVHTYAFQLFTALKHLRNCGVLHCDIKPDNMLVNETKNTLKLCDFGSAMFAGDNSITPYLVSRFYRAPEIILGLPYDHALDMWSVGCCLYELFTGKVLFPGPTNNDMLRLHMELKGPFPKKMLRKAAFAGMHFDQDFNFYAVEEDPVTKKAVKRMITNIKPKEFSSLTSSSVEDPKHLASFKLLLEKIFVLDPEKRLTVSQALDHPFIRQGFDLNNIINNNNNINNLQNQNGSVQHQNRR